LLTLAALLPGGCATAPPAPTPAAPPTQVERPPKVGLALGGGGARGFAEIGVLRVLEQEKIPIHLVVGTSVGSLVGALYADSGRVLDAEFHALAVQEEDLFDVRALAILSGGLVKGERLRKFVKTHVKAASIEEMAVPFAAVATDLRTGSAVVFDRGPVVEAVHASCAIPGVFVPVQVGDVTLVDGGVVEPVPAAVARRLGATVVIAVAIPAAVPPAAPRSPLGVAYHAVTIMAAELGRLKARDADVLIEPQVGDVAYNDFSQKKRLIEAGEDAARAALPAIRAALARPGGARP
jgi:NTE family protein